jgi:UDP-N-acetylmuramyl pentapeptide phosphotransferase/UDP-N-acetylglucosamine-1-phosphate transferase
MEISDFIFNLLILSFCLIFTKFSKKYSFLLDSYSENHKKFIKRNNETLIIGFSCIPLFIYLFIIFNIKFLLFIPIFYLFGLLSDLDLIRSPRKRFLLQILLFFVLITIFQIKIDKTRLEFLDSLLANNYFNIAFSIFCLMVLMNGSNFIDGINTLLIGYLLIIFFILFLISQNIDADYRLIKIVLIFLSFIFILNFFQLSFLGDGGAYSLSVLVGLLLMDISNSNQLSSFAQYHLSPFFIILLLWYPCFENLFSIIRRVLKKKETVLADNSHLHHYLYQVIKNILKNENYYVNSLTGCIINAYNFIIFYFSRNYFYSSKFCISIILFNITIYICSYYLLKSYLKNNKIS